jgi:hypothetical protein
VALSSTLAVVGTTTHTGAVTLTGGINTGTITGTLPAIPNNWITAAGIAAGAIDNATFAADVGSTAYATNIIALAVDKALDNLGLTVTEAGVLGVNVQYINDVELTGTGVEGDEWGPA